MPYFLDHTRDGADLEVSELVLENLRNSFYIMDKYLEVIPLLVPAM